MSRFRALCFRRFFGSAFSSLINRDIGAFLHEGLIEAANGERRAHGDAVGQGAQPLAAEAPRDLGFREVLGLQLPDA
jgi:hypothetical protein